MWYILSYEKTHIYPYLAGGRTADPSGGLAVVRGFCPTPLPNPAGQCAGPDRARYRRDSRLRRSNGPPCHSCLQCPRADRVAAWLVCPPADPACCLYAHPTRAVACPPAPEPAHLWLPHQSVDSAFSRRGGVCRRPDVAPGEWRSHPPG